MIHFNEEIEQFWTYRTARVVTEVSIDMDNKDWAMLTKYLQRNGKCLENHIAWKAGSLYFQYSDYKLYVGTEILVKC